MLGLSYGEIFLLLGATAALIGPKDLPMISRTAGRLAGRAIGYVQLARGQFDTVMQQSQARQVHKELQDTMAQLDAIRHEIRSISLVNPGPLTRRLDNLDQTSMANDNKKPEDAGVNNSISSANKDSTSLSSNSCNMQSQATTYSRLVESSAIKNGLLANSTKVGQNKDELQLTEDSTSLSSNLCNMQSQATTYARLAKSPGLKNSLLADSTEVEKKIDELQVTVLPVSAENAGLLPNRDAADVKGSDIVLEAILEAEVANNAKEFFSHPQNQI